MCGGLLPTTPGMRPGTISRAVDLILVGRHLERIADHATNIAEDVIYMVRGRTIKHHIEEGRATGLKGCDVK